MILIRPTRVDTLLVAAEINLSFAVQVGLKDEKTFEDCPSPTDNSQIGRHVTLCFRPFWRETTAFLAKPSISDATS
jgi:hypothetical protein